MGLGPVYPIHLICVTDNYDYHRLTLNKVSDQIHSYHLESGGFKFF